MGITTSRPLYAVAIAVAVAVGASGCATPNAPGGEPPSGVAASGEVVGQGTVLQVAPAAPQLCLGAVAESYPPQCDGPEIVGWDWDEVDGEESASGVTWGAYAVQGTWDGERFTVTQPPVLLALYDPMPIKVPELDPANAGSTSEAELVRIQEELAGERLFEFLTSAPQNGYLFITVVYDNGDIQRYLDERYGADVVVIQSALRPVSG